MESQPVSWHWFLASIEYCSTVNGFFKSNMLWMLSAQFTPALKLPCLTQRVILSRSFFECPNVFRTLFECYALSYSSFFGNFPKRNWKCYTLEEIINCRSSLPFLVTSAQVVLKYPLALLKKIDNTCVLVTIVPHWIKF